MDISPTLNVDNTTTPKVEITNYKSTFSFFSCMCLILPNEQLQTLQSNIVYSLLNWWRDLSYDVLWLLQFLTETKSMSRVVDPRELSSGQAKIGPIKPGSRPVNKIEIFSIM